MGKRVGLTAKQRELRRTGTGSSEIATVAGMGYGSILDIWASKVHGVEKDQTLPMELGSLTEDPIAELYSRRTGLHLSKPGTLVCEGKPIILATPDRLAHSRKPEKLGKGRQDWDSVDRLVECKHTNMRMRYLWGQPGTDQVPEDYLVQATWEMRSTGAKADAPRVRVCDLPVLFDKAEFSIFTVHYSVELALALEEINDRFWTEYVLTRKEPPPEASDRYREILTRLHPTHPDPDRYEQATEELVQAALALRQIKAVQKALKLRRNLLENVLRQAIGDATGLQGTFGTASWRKTRDGTKIDYSAVALALRDELRKHTGDQAAKTFAELVAKHTAIKPGVRRLMQSWNKTLDEPALALPEQTAIELRLESGPQQPEAEEREEEANTDD